MGGASFFEIFNKNNWRRTLAGCVGICSQWAAGAPIVFGYSTVSTGLVIAADLLVLLPSRWSRGSFPRISLDVSFAVARRLTFRFVILIISISVSLVSCEYIGRRPLLVGGCALMCLFNIGVATSGLFAGVAAGKAALGCLLCWVFCYGASAGPIGFVAAAETSTPRLRAQTTSFNLGCYGLGL
jgi:SP family general alpha glucoside:H+ symporter-like MFS transporter